MNNTQISKFKARSDMSTWRNGLWHTFTSPTQSLMWIWIFTCSEVYFLSPKLLVHQFWSFQWEFFIPFMKIIFFINQWSSSGKKWVYEHICFRITSFLLLFLTLSLRSVRHQVQNFWHLYRIHFSRPAPKSLQTECECFDNISSAFREKKRK